MRNLVAHASFVGASALFVATTACTVFSGWSDLQDGKVDSGTRANNAPSDAATPPADATTPDTSVSDAAVQCTSARDCSGGYCCFNTGFFTRTCGTQCPANLAACAQDDQKCPPSTQCIPFSSDAGAGGFYLCQP